MTPSTDPPIACVMMQKDEERFLGPWMAYHGHLFGFRNLWVIDNGSTAPEVLSTLADFEARGVHIVRSYPTHKDYLNKGAIVGEHIRALDMTGRYELLIPSDCDEFIVKQTDVGFSCDRAVILGSLSELYGEDRILRIPFQLANNPFRDDCYIWFEFFKTFFARDTFLSLDHGHHSGRSKKSSGRKDTPIVQIHYHYPGYEGIKDIARKKWIGQEPLDGIESAASYNGPFPHLVRNFFMEEREYQAHFAEQVQFHFPAFRHLLRQLGQPIGVTIPDVSAATERTPLLLPASRAPNLPPTVWLYQSWYDSQNADIAPAKMAPLAHFCHYGFKEGRWPCAPEDLVSGCCRT